MDNTIALVLESIWFGILILQLGAWWTLFKKAGEPGWAAIVPFYNLYVMLRIADKPGWWFAVILFVPFLSLVFWILMCVSIAQNFGKGTGYALGIIFLPFIFVPILAFGKATYLTIPGAPVSQDNEIPPDRLTPMTPVTSQGWRS
jgi:hypothetical protein